MKTLMMSLKAMALAALLITGTQSFAQDKMAARGSNPEMSKEKREQRFADASKRLNLTADQQTKIKAVLSQNRTDMKALREANKDKAKDEKRKAMIDQMKKADGQVTAVLDAKQQQIYKQMKEEKKADMKTKRAERMKVQDEMEDVGVGIF